MYHVAMAGFPTPLGRFPNTAATAPNAALDSGHFSQWSSHLHSTALREQREASQGHPSSFSLCGSNKEERGTGSFFLPDGDLGG